MLIKSKTTVSQLIRVLHFLLFEMKDHVTYSQSGLIPAGCKSENLAELQVHFARQAYKLLRYYERLKVRKRFNGNQNESSAILLL